jgi:endonuclease/exonuclease/phosphatase family metal-dependent hydrolase
MSALTVASYNMRKAIGTDRRRSPERVLEVLREIDADVIALQEADRRFGKRMAVIPPHMLEEHTDWKAVGFGVRAGSSGWHGNAILVRKSARVLDCEVIHLPALEPRGAVMVDVEIGGRSLRVVGMHLDLSGLSRRRQAHAILTHVAASSLHLPAILMGDLNEWSAARGCLRDFGREMSFAPTAPSFHARRPIARLDRIIVSREVEVLDSGTHSSPTARTASDHLPVWARVRV